MSKDTKKCYNCNINKTIDNFYKLNSTKTFPDGFLYICNDCVMDYGETINKEIVKLLWLCDVPVLKGEWAKSVVMKQHTLIAYLKKMKLKSNQNLRYKDSDTQITFDKKIDFELTNEYLYGEHNNAQKSVDELFDAENGDDFLLDKEGKKIFLTTEIRKKWLSKDKTFEDFELLELEKYVTDMKLDFNIEDTSSVNLLNELALLSVKKTRALSSNAISDYSNLDKSYQNKLKDAGFRPIDKKSGSEKTGVDSLGQMVLQIEREGGFIAPQRVEFKPDDIDKMLTWYVKWAQGFTNQAIETKTITEWREDISDEDISFKVDEEANEDESEDEE